MVKYFISIQVHRTSEQKHLRCQLCMYMLNLVGLFCKTYDQNKGSRTAEVVTTHWHFIQQKYISSGNDEVPYNLSQTLSPSSSEWQKAITTISSDTAAITFILSCYELISFHLILYLAQI